MAETLQLKNPVKVAALLSTGTPHRLIDLKAQPLHNPPYIAALFELTPELIRDSEMWDSHKLFVNGKRFHHNRVLLVGLLRGKETLANVRAALAAASIEEA